MLGAFCFNIVNEDMLRRGSPNERVGKAFVKSPRVLGELQILENASVSRILERSKRGCLNIAGMHDRQVFDDNPVAGTINEIYSVPIDPVGHNPGKLCTVAHDCNRCC